MHTSKPRVSFADCEIRVINTFLNVVDPMAPSVRSSFSEPLPVMHFPSESEMPMTSWKTYDSFDEEVDVDGEPFVAKICTLDYFETVSTFQGEPVELLKEPLNTNLSSPALHHSEPSEPFVCKLSTFELFEETPTVAPNPLFPLFPAFIDSEMRELNICNVSTYDSFCDGVPPVAPPVAPVVSEPVQKLSTFDFFEHGTPAPLAPLAPLAPAPCVPCGVPAVPVPMTWPLPSQPLPFLQPPCFQDDTSNNSCLSTSPRTPVTAPITPITSSTSGASGPLSGPLQVTGASGEEVVRWTVDARKLESQDKQILSPQFDLYSKEGTITPFRLMILAKETRGKGCRGFLKAKGRGRLFMKCESSSVSEMAPVAFRVTVGPGTAAEKSKVLEAHQFADHSCCPFQEGKEDWDLLPTADMSKHFEIMVEVLH